MSEVGIDSKKVDKCIENSYFRGGLNQPVTDNRLLSEDRRWSQQLGIILHP